MAAGCDFEFMEYVDEQSIDPNLICSICHKALKDPVSTPCDHTYGRGCISRWLEESENRACPMCTESPLAVEQLIQASRPLRNMLDQIRVKCTLCGESDLRRGNFIDHINKICPKAMVQCKAVDIKCPWQGTRDELPNHAETCVFEPLRPVLSSLIAENQQLNAQVQKHDDVIKQLIRTIAQLKNIPVNNSDDDSDTSSISNLAVNNIRVREEDAVFIRNLPATVKFNDVFDVFSKVGRIKFNEHSKKSNIFIFKNPRNKDGRCNAKVYFVDKESVAAAIAEYNDKRVSPWDTTLKVGISYKSNNRENFGKDNAAKTIPQVEADKATENVAKPENRNQKPINSAAQSESTSAESQTKPKKNRGNSASGTNKPKN